MEARRERIWAAVAHGTAWIPVAGVLVALAVYVWASSQRPFAARHARAALALQVGAQGALALLLLLASGLVRLARAWGWPREPLLVGLAAAVALVGLGSLAAAGAGARAAWRGQPWRA